jgi:hypothetical protein
MKEMISSRRHSQSATVATLVPLAKVKGSGSALSLKPGSVAGVAEHAG